MKARDGIKSAILEEAGNLFFSRGFKKVTVDEIAFNLKISKKTIYKYYKSKKALLAGIIDEFINAMTTTMYAILENKELSFPEKLENVMSQVGMKLGKINSIFFSDLRENTPDLWKVVEDYKHDAAFLRFKMLIEQGKEKGHIKKDIDKNIVIALYASAIENLFDPYFLANLPQEIREGIPDNPSEIFNDTLKIIYQGILTDKTIRSLKN